MKSTTIVTPWLGHPELAAGYLDAVVGELDDADWALVVDNGDAPPLPGCAVVTVGGNLGFARGSNLGLERATTDLVVFVNNDVTLGRRGWLDELRRAVEPGVLAGPLRYDRHADVDGIPLPYIDGWCLAGTRADLLELGGFDPDLDEPAYYSDNILCLRARAAGMTLREVRVGLRHMENVTAGPAHDGTVAAASAANRVRYLALARELLVAA